MTLGAWAGIASLAKRLSTKGWFGLSFGEECRDGRGITGTDERGMTMALISEIPQLQEWWQTRQREAQTSNFFGGGFRAKSVPRRQMPNSIWKLIDPAAPPDTLTALDVVEFLWRHAALPTADSHHSYYEHDHLSFNQDRGRAELVKEVNLLLARSGLAFVLRASGRVERIGSPVLQQALVRASLNTGDRELDALLAAAVTKFKSPSPEVRQEALERLWDAWERAKDLSVPGKKKQATKVLLDGAASEPAFRQFIEADAAELTRAGNQFFIRHSELKQLRVRDSRHTEYLFHRLFALVWLVLRSR